MDPLLRTPSQQVGAVPAIPDLAPGLSRLTANVPDALAARMKGARLVGERKPVTALFADIVGSTALAEVIDPEDWTTIINGAFDLMSQAVFAYEGTVAQLQGDALICFFGAPVAHEDDPERAVRAALAMSEAIDGYGRDLQAADGIDFRIRIGISTGLVLVGNVGSDLRFDYTAIGDTMNVAARLQASAPPGGILISDRTQRFVAPLFELESVGPLELKGKSAAVMAYRVVSALPERGRTRGLVGLAGLESPMIGRDEQLRRLVGLCDTMRAGRGRVAFVIGEPGIGKSRLVGELRAVVDQIDEPERPVWVTAQALSYGRTMALHLVQDLVRRLLGVTPGNTPDEVEMALATRLPGLMPDEADVQLAYLRYLLQLPLPPEDSERLARLEPMLLPDRTLGAALRLIRAICRQGPLIIVLEDLHWADASSAEFVKGLLTVVDEVPILLICSTREEHAAPGWDVLRVGRERFGRALTEIGLTPLDAGDTRSLVANLLEIESLPATVRDLILTKAEGNPFFVEEVIRMLIERDAIERQGTRWVATGAVEGVEIPDTVHGLVLARIDRLPADARSILRVASVIDRQFPVPLLEAVLRAGGSDIETGPALGRLEAADLLTLAAVDPELEYRFGHALIQDAAYESILRQDRREWHRLVAEELQRRNPDRARALAARLGRHLELAGETEQAIGAYLSAADDALERGGAAEALELYQRAGTLLGPVPGSDDPAESVEQTTRRARSALGQVATGFAFMAPDTAFGLVAQARSWAELVGDIRLQAGTAFWEAWLLRSAGATADTSDALNDALERARMLGAQVGDDAYRGRPLLLMGEIELSAGRIRRALDLLAEAEPLLQARRDVIGESMLANVRSGAYALLGEFDSAAEQTAHAIAVAEHGDPLSQIDARLGRAMVDRERGDYSTSVRFAGECMQQAEEIGSLSCAAFASLALGEAQLGLERDSAARDTLERGLELSVQSHLRSQRLAATGMLSEIHGLSGELDEARSGWQGALDGFHHLGDVLSAAQVRTGRAEALIRGPHPDPASALADLDEAVRVLETLEARPRLARALRARGRVLHGLGRDEEAEASLARASGIAAQIGLRDGPWPVSVAELDRQGPG